MEKLAGYVEHIIYRNTDNGYTVLNLVSGEDEITCVGIFSTIAEGENIEATGDYTDHPTYGTQFKVVSFEEKAPEDQEAIERYLGSGAIKGIGLAMAARIVRRFKEDTFRIIEEEPERLAEVKGISERKAMEIASQVNEKRDLRQAMIFLQQFGITMNLAVKIYNKYGQEVYGILKENPYRLADDIEGVGFRTADDIAAKAGIRTDSDFRVRSGILYTLLQASGEGHTFLPQEELTAKTSEYDRIAGLDNGADDYIPKPFSMLEMVARVKALLRRTEHTKNQEDYSLEHLYVCPAKHVVKVDGEDVTLTLKEFEMLCILLQNQGIVLTRDQLLNKVWGYSFDGESRTVDVHIRTLRQKLGVAAEAIKTIRGVGYKI